MTQAGGPAAINGFLYQILHHLGWIADIKLTGTIVDQAIEGDACLVLEPRDGGDARAETAAAYVVEQYKTRSDGTWSVNALIGDVLPDLRKSVREPPVRNALYRFVTDGRPGRLETFKTFLAAVRSAQGRDDLDDQETYLFGEDLPSTHSALFNYIVEATRRESERPRADERASVFHLLSRFEMDFEARAELLAEKVERLLRHYVPNLGDERGMREQLIGVLVENLAKGEVRFGADRIDELFRQVGLSPDRLRNLARLSETMAALARERLQRMKYRPEVDVRGLPPWPLDKPVLLVAGESGEGKTWLLCRLVTALADARQIVTLVLPAKDAEMQLTRASDDVWQTGLGETSQKTLGALTMHYRAMAREVEIPWLTVAVDDVQDVDFVRDLVRRDWTLWGMRLALTVPTRVARIIEMTDSETVGVHWVGPFSVDELDELLKQKGRRWSDLPADLKELLRTPILAGLYMELPYESFQTAPRSEYEIFERFWDRINIRAGHGDDGILLAVASRILDGKVYPVPRTAWSEVGLFDNGLIARLEAAGWLHCAEGGDISFAHDRLLNWGVAKALAHKVKHGELSVDELGGLLAKCADSFTRPFSRRLDYVPMDTLWLLTADAARTNDCGRLLEGLEATRHFGSYGEDLYTELLPTLGDRAVPLLLNRLDAFTAGKEGDYHVGLIAKGLAALARQEGVDLTNVVDGLLNSPSRDRQAVAITLLTATSNPHHLDRLWELHQERCRVIDDRDSPWTHSDYQASFAAMRAGTELDPEWLRRRIYHADAQREQVSELAYLLKNLGHPEAANIWKQTRDILMAKVRPDKPRSLLHCIGRFKDVSKVSFVLECLQRREDYASSAALANLALLDPDLAIKRLIDVEKIDRYMARNDWLPLLLRARPDQTRQRVLELAKNESDGRRLIETLFTDRADQLDSAMLQFQLRGLEADLRERRDAACDGDPSWLFHPLRFLAGITHRELIDVLAQEAGGELERMITQVACSRVPHQHGSYDHVLEYSRRVLILIGGDGITVLVNRELEADHYWGRYGGLKWVILRPDATTLKQLAAIARRPISTDENQKPDSNALHEHYEAAVALAALQADGALVDAIWISPYVATDSVTLRNMCRPMDKGLTKRAAEVLTEDDPAEDNMLRALTVAWLSADPDLIPRVRAVFAHANAESKIAGLACIALQQLGDRSSEFSQLAARLVPTKENSRWGMNALITTGKPGFERLAGYLRNKPVSTWQNEDESLISILHNEPSTRTFAIESAVRYCLERHSLDPPYDIAAEANDEKMRKKILNDAFAPHSISTAVSLRAIEGLAKFDIDRAIEAAEYGLRLGPAIERELCRLLVQLAPNTAATKLINAALSIERKSLRPTVGRALRRLDPAMVEPVLEERMGDPDRSIRAVVAELTGWLPPGRLTETLDNLTDHDTEDKVRVAALTALDRRQREEIVLTLSAAFRQASGNRRWSLLIAILEAGDAHLLTDRDDPLWLGHILTDAPYAFAYHAKAVLADRKRKEK
ncbi:MAG: hypothetical protein A3I78_10240 [Gammaproteobacteria bacterium RIFCSPLOWO2_02_FULL_56_15]|nr:MAG: hypothetical protein A3I78_10240 [Gammaproteobacteria bacterium RIFCSPLOWO2_02_FULL_56_15]